MKNKLFALPLVATVSLASFFLTWIIYSEAYTRITATWVMAAFTIVLAVATIWNGKITQNLLKQSKEASRQTRQAFEIDTFNKIVSSASQLNAELRATKNFPQNERPDYVKNFAAGMLITVKDIDPIMFEKISKAIKAWNERDSRTPATTFLKALNKIKD